MSDDKYLRVHSQNHAEDYKSSVEDALGRVIALVSFQREDWAFYGQSYILRRAVRDMYRARKSECAELLLFLKTQDSVAASRADSYIAGVWWE